MQNNALMNQYGWGGGGGMQGGFPSFSQYQSWNSMRGAQPQQQPYQVGQNNPIDSNAGFRTDPNVNYTPVNPYGMNQSNQNSWTGNGWTSNRGTPVPADQLGGYMQNRQQRGQSERPEQQQWNPGPNTGTQTPYQIKPGGGGPISMDPRSGPQPWANNGGRAPWDIEPPRGGPGQSPTFAPRRNIPQSSFGQQNPTRFNQHFANTPFGQQGAGANGGVATIPGYFPPGVGAGGGINGLKDPYRLKKPGLTGPGFRPPPTADNRSTFQPRQQKMGFGYM